MDIYWMMEKGTGGGEGVWAADGKTWLV